MSSATHPQFPSKIPQMGDIVTMEISHWPHGRNRDPLTRKEKGFVIYQEAFSDDECHIHLLNPYTDIKKTRRTLIRKAEGWSCGWLKTVEHQVAITWKPLISINTQ